MPTQTMNLELEVDYASKTVPEPKGVVLLLHGYQQEGDTIFKLLENYLPPNHVIVAPNAPLPLAHPYGKRLKLAYTWYLYDPGQDRYLLDMNLALNYLKQWYATLPISNLPLSIVGYSQGGYLAPFAGMVLPNVHQVIGLNCRFRSESIRETLPFRLDALHGEDDPLVDPVRAHRCHQELMANGNRGAFQFIANSGHRITPALGAKLRSILENT